MTPYKLALYERQHQMAEFLIKNGAEAHSVMKPKRTSENPDVPESRTEDKGSTSATKEDNENSSSSHTVEETKPEGFLSANYDDGIVPLPTANTELPSSPGPPGPPGQTILHSICSNNGPGGPTGPCPVPPPKLTRSKIRTTLKPYVPPPVLPRIISAALPRSIIPSHSRCMPPGQPHQVEDTKPEGFLPANYDDGIVPLPPANSELPSSPDPPRLPGPPLLHSICSNNVPGGSTGPCTVPPPKLTRSKIRTTLKPYVPPPLQPQDISAGPSWSISLSRPRYKPPGQPHQLKIEIYLVKVEETKPEGLLPANYDDVIVPLPTANTEIPSSPGDTFNPQSANEYFSATNPAEYTHYATHSKVLPLWEATVALLMLTTGIWFLKFVSTVMMWVFNLI